MDEQVAIANFIAVTGANGAAAQRVLEMCDGNVEHAVTLWFSEPELQGNVLNAAAPAAASASASASAHAGSRSRAARPTTGREDAQGVIHLDDSDNDPISEDGGSLSDVEDGAAAQAATVARTAQELEDAEMAQRLQDEINQRAAADVDADGVRAPMERRTEVLVNGGGFDEDDDFQGYMEHLHRRNQARARAGNPFSQSVWDSPLPAQPGGSGPGGPPNSRANHLADLFRPPYNLIERVTWDEARDLGKDEKRWLLVNLQNPADFHSQALNRDIWKDAAVVALVREHFVFLQYEKGHPAADQYVSFYFPDQAHERAETYPHVSIVDPRTGEQVKTWSGAPFPSAVDFHAQLVEFLDRYSLEANSKNPVVRAKRPEAPRKNIERMTEEEMFEMALQNSLHPNGGGGGGGGVGGASASFDPDALTKSPAESQTRAAEAQGDNDGDEETATAESAAFARIASNRPHVEPTADPATTTRIQVRHPEGRLIRRFALDERVARIYEWLKAAPLAGQEGVAFELKVVPQGHDLLADLERPIAEVDGLRNGTVAMEFV